MIFISTADKEVLYHALDNGIADGDVALLPDAGASVVHYGSDEGGLYARLEVSLSTDWYAEIDGATYGELQAIRIYL